jgi:phospholipid N-methyltransferase
MQESQSVLFQRLLFLYKFIRSPKTVGSITPSSIFLSKEMMKKVDWDHSKTIVELGAGMGCFTSQIQKLKLPDCKVLVFELDPEMCNLLQEKYPDFYFYSNAKNIFSAMKEQGLTEVDCIVSGLPFSNFSVELREHIIDQVFEALKPGGIFVTFQYSLHMKKYLTSVFGEVNISLVPLNVPPAFVYRCKK